MPYLRALRDPGKKNVLIADKISRLNPDPQIPKTDQRIRTSFATRTIAALLRPRETQIPLEQSRYANMEGITVGSHESSRNRHSPPLPNNTSRGADPGVKQEHTSSSPLQRGVWRWKRTRQSGGTCRTYEPLHSAACSSSPAALSPPPGPSGPSPQQTPSAS